MDTEALKKSLVGRFIEATADRLQAIQLAALELEKAGAPAALETLARELHTMKGEARMLGLRAVGQLAHAAEDVLAAHRAGSVEAKVATDLLLRACDAVVDLLDDAEASASGSDAGRALLEVLSAASGRPVPPLQPTAPAGRAGAPRRPGSQSGSQSGAQSGAQRGAQSGARRAPDAAAAASPEASVEALSKPPPGPAPSPAPPPPVPRPVWAGGTGAADGHGASSAAPGSAPGPAGQADFASSLSGIAARPEGPEGVERRPAERSMRVSVDTLDAMGLLAGDLLVEGARARLRGTEAGRLLERFARLGEDLVRLKEAGAATALARAEVLRLEDALHHLRDDAFRFVRRHGDGLDALQGALGQLAEHVGTARLVPLAAVFEAFPRALRDLAQSLGKEVELVVENDGAAVDRTMVADVREALLHLIRNAVDHGLEAPSEREAVGKRATGRVWLRARLDGDQLWVEVADDGRGMDPAQLAQAAVRGGFLSEAQAAGLTERERLALIFRPGFSTRDTVSELSGRGVGMDVVKRKVEHLGGSVAIHSEVGQGTRIGMRLPQSLALMRVLLLRLGDDVYGLPASDVEAVLRVSSEARLEVMGTLAVMYRGRPTVLAAMGPLLGLNGGPRTERPLAVLVRHGDDRAALVVDGFVGEREVAVKPIGGELFKGAPFVGGAASLEDGRAAVLLHVPDLMAEVRRVARPAPEARAATRLRVLLVDDSPIARATESALVRALGHELEEAQDGEEAWSRLQVQTFDLVVTDVQMPKLDGFALTQRIRQSPVFESLPVVILSSLASPEDRRRGLEAGASAYLVKGELGVDSLAAAFERLV